MRVSLDWLQEYTSFDDTAEALAEKLTMMSLESDVFLEPNELFHSTLIGQVESIESHPNADTLWVCHVNFGNDETEQVVCGAPNVAADQKVPVVQPGVTLPNGMTVETAELRGVQSNGMIPSERELGLSDSHAGIMVLRDDAEIGSVFWDYLKRYWRGLDIEITPNRPDCMSHFGVAREISAIYRAPLRFPEPEIRESEDHITELAEIRIREPDRCPRYAARIIRDVNIGSSPLWLQQRLASVGLRPINNVVDISNYVLMETGHPLHTFDYDTLAGPAIEVRSAYDGETFTTLDGKERELDEDVLLICDANKPVAIAGVMGGENSEVTGDTKNILIESAYFDPTTIRRSSKYLGLSTESSKRFERGADPNGVLNALNRITSLIQQIAGGEVAEGVLDEYPNPISSQQITLRAERVEQILGIVLSTEEMGDILTSLQFDIEGESTDTLEVSVPTFRPDITREVDLIEEVLRMYGTENVQAPRVFQFPMQTISSVDRSAEDRMDELWKGFGFNRTFSNSLVKEEYCYPDTTGKTPVRVANPLSEEMAYMRTTLIPLLLRGVQMNRNRKENDIRLYEIGRVFSANPSAETGADESSHFCAICAGKAAPTFWEDEEKEIDFWDLKGYIQVTLEALGLTDVSYISDSSAFFEPGFRIMVHDDQLGYGGRFYSGFLEGFELSPQIFGVELSLDVIHRYAAREALYQKPSDFPPVERDLSFIVSDKLPAGDLTRLIRSTGGELLSSLTLYDVYRGEPVPEDKKSLTYSLRFLSPERTLTEEEIDRVQEEIVRQAEKQLDVHLRRE